MTGSDFSQLAAWMKAQAENMQYGEVTARIIVHDGRVQFIEKSVSEKTKTPAGTGAGKN